MKAGTATDGDIRAISTYTTGWFLSRSGVLYANSLERMNYSKRLKWPLSVGIPLTDAIQYYSPASAILQALVKCKRHHCDVSINNILIVRKKGTFYVGNLIDWEFSCKSKEKEEAGLYNRFVRASYHLPSFQPINLIC